MAAITISDVHGMTFWKNVVDSAKPNDHIVFLGDYFDKRGCGPYAKSQADNFLEICDLAKNNSNVHLLMGNHDFQYTPYDRIGTTSYDKYEGKKFQKAIMDHFKMIDLVYIQEIGGKKYIFSHAGVTKDWMGAMDIQSVNDINAFYHDNPRELSFIEFCNGQYAEGHGNNVWQNPLWIRPPALIEGAVCGYNQVVGHTEVADIEQIETKCKDDIFFTCTFDARCLILNDSYPCSYDFLKPDC